MPGVPLLRPKLLAKKNNAPKRAFGRILIFIATLSLLLFSIYEWSQLSSHPNVMSIRNTHPDFVGREGYLDDLKTLCFSKKEGVSVGVLWGEGGIGKSEIAVAFANKYQRHFSLIYWIECSSEDKYRQSYLRLAELLAIDFDDKDPIEVLRQRVHEFLQLASWKKKWLLVCDNVEERLELPEQGNGVVLLTARSKASWESYSCLQVVPFQPEEAVALIAKIAKDHTMESWKKLFKKFDYVPLAINVAAHYIATTPDLSVAKYLELLKINRLALLEQMPKDSRYAQNILASWRMSTDALKSRHPEAYAWLHFCAYLYPDAIPLDWISQWLEMEGWKQGVSLKAYEIIRVLTQHGLVRYDQKTQMFSLHRLKQKWLKATAENSAEVSERVLAFLAKRLHSVDYFDEIEWTPAVWKDLEIWAPHAHWVVSRVKETFTSNELAIVLNILGNYYQVVTSNYKKGLKCYERGLEIHRRLEGPGHLYDYALLLCNLGSLVGHISQHQNAIDYLEESLKICEQVCGDTPNALLAGIYTNLGAISFTANEFKEALVFFEKAVQLHETIFGSTPHPSTSEALKWLGGYWKRVGNLKNALNFEEKALEINLKFYKQQPNVQLGYIYSFLGQIHSEMGNLKEALKFEQQGMDLSLKLHPKGTHIQILYSLMWMGTHYDRLGSYNQAINYFERAVNLQKKLFRGKVSHHSARILRDYGVALQHLGKAQKAMEYYQAALEANRKLYGNNTNFEDAFTLGRCGQLLCILDRKSEGIPFIEQSLDLCRTFDKAIPRPFVLNILKFLAEVYKCDDPQRARAYLEEAQQIESLTSKELVLGQKCAVRLKSSTTLESVFKFRMPLSGVIFP